MPSLSSVSAFGVLLALALWVSPAVLAQGTEGSCDAALDDAQERYVREDFEAAEELIMGCMEDATPADVIRGHRLLALVLMRQGRMTDAQFAVLRILATDYGYQPDEDRDPPFYVALVSTVQNQLRVDSTLALAGGVPPPVRSADVTPADPVAPAPLRVRIEIPEIAASSGSSPSSDDMPSTPILDDAVADGGRVVRHFAAGGGRAAESSPSGEMVNLNTATADELDTLPGIGPALAGRIIAYREAYGAFRVVEEVLEVRGVGPRVLEGFADRVTVE